MFRFALQNVMSRPIRSSLAIVGMMVAIMGMVGLFSIAEGLDQVIGNTLNRVPGLVAMQRGAPIPLFSTLPESWTEELEDIPGVKAVSPECWARANVINGQIVVSPPRLLCGCDIVRRMQLETAIYREDMVAGRYLESQDIGQFHCVISQPIAEEHECDIGDVIEVNGYELTVIGIYYTGSLLLDVAILMDDEAFREMVRFDHQTVSSFYIEQDGTATDEELLQRIKEHFRGRGPGTWSGTGLMSVGSGNPLQSMVDSLFDLLNQNDTVESPEEAFVQGQSDQTKSNKRTKSGQSSEYSEVSVEDDPMEIRLATDWAGRFDKFAEDLDLALWLLTMLGILIAVVSIVNTMLMSVTERVGEFGVLRANGWSRTDLIHLIAWESLIIGFTGGVLGCLIGWTGTIIVNATYPAKFELYASPALLLYALLFSAILGGLSGLYPAWWAARMPPMQAIRRN